MVKHLVQILSFPQTLDLDGEVIKRRAVKSFIRQVVAAAKRKRKTQTAKRKTHHKCQSHPNEIKRKDRSGANVIKLFYVLKS
jgi:hypothetical protein